MDSAAADLIDGLNVRTRARRNLLIPRDLGCRLQRRMARSNANRSQAEPGNATMADGTQTFIFSFGPLSGLTDIANIAVIGNLYADNDDRNPYFQTFTTGVIVNNVIYNAARYAIEVNWIPDEWAGKN